MGKGRAVGRASAGGYAQTNETCGAIIAEEPDHLAGRQVAPGANRITMPTRHVGGHKRTSTTPGGGLKRCLMPTTHSRPFLVFARTYSRLAGVLTAAAGLAVLAGWWLNQPRLQSLLSGAIGTKANTAAAFILAGAALWLLHVPGAQPRWLAIRRACAALVALIGLLVLLE